MIRCWTFISFFLLACDAYKFLINSPLFGYSHTNFMAAIADTLTEAGHNVTVLMPVLKISEENRTGLKLTKNIIKIPMNTQVYDLMKNEEEALSSIWDGGTSVFQLLQSTRNMSTSFVYLCEGIFRDEKIMQMLEGEKFDVGISEVFDICGLGIFEILKIPATIATISSTHLDCASKSIGEPIIPSYVPGKYYSYFLSLRKIETQFKNKYEKYCDFVL